LSVFSSGFNGKVGHNFVDSEWRRRTTACAFVLCDIFCEIDPWYEEVRLKIGQLAKLIVTMQKRKISAVDL
jgi:hypothetical protein